MANQKVTYDPNTDYQALITQAEAAGDYASAAKYEQQRNAKIADLDASGTNIYNAVATNKYQNGTTSPAPAATGTTTTPAPATAGNMANTFGSVANSVASAVAQKTGASGTTTTDKTVQKAPQTQPTQPAEPYVPGYVGTYFEDIINDPNSEYNARAWIPGSGWTSIVIKDGRTVTTGLPAGTIVDTAGGAYQITGTNADGTYTSNLYTGKMPETVQVGWNPYKDGYTAADLPEILEKIESGEISPSTGPVNGGNANIGSTPNGGTVSGSASGSVNSTPSALPSAPDLTGLLEAWKQAAEEQAKNQTDYATQQAILELERAVEDAQGQFKQQQESNAIDERQALDNSALYSELRGDKGGIGQEQYNEIQNAAAANRLAVQQAQTKLATDTDRQIADLRAQGEFEKADKVLEIAQTYLSNLVSLEQWAAEYNMSAAQFAEQVRQWNAEFEQALKEFDASLGVQNQGTLAEQGQTLLSAGIMPSASQLAAMGWTEAQATQYLNTLALQSASTGKTGGTTYTGIAAEIAAKDYTTHEQIVNFLLEKKWDLGDAEVYADNYLAGLTADDDETSGLSVSGRKLTEEQWDYLREQYHNGVYSADAAYEVSHYSTYRAYSEAYDKYIRNGGGN